jgi:putative heme transporter
MPSSTEGEEHDRDLLCLFFALRAFEVSVSVVGIAVLYVVTQLVRQVPLTPGGIGVIEATLLTGLVSLGADAALAAGGVLAYRLLSFWLVVPAGLTSWLVLRRSWPGPQP